MGVQVEKDLVLATHDESELAPDIYRAPYDDAPVTVYVHGGGGAAATKRTTVHGAARRPRDQCPAHPRAGKPRWPVQVRIRCSYRL